MTYALKHGAARRSGKFPEYLIWIEMRQRCNNPNHKRYADYGGRRIKVCSRWGKFANFIKDVGRRPSARYSLDRFPNNNGNYSPKNCRWSTAKEQTANTRRNVFVLVGGERMPLVAAVRKYGGRYGTVLAKVHRGIEPEIALGLRR